MKLTYVINNFSLGGAENGLLHLIDYGFFEGVSLEVIALAKGGFQLAAELEKRGVPYTVIHNHANMRAQYLGEIIIGLYHELKSTQPDCVILSLPQATICGRIAAQMACPTAKVFTFEHSARFSKRIYEPLFYITQYANYGMLYDSEATRVGKASFYRKKTPSFYVPLVAVKTDSKACDYKLHSPVRLLIAGRLISAKNHMACLDAVKLLKDQGIKVTLDIAGEGAERENITQKIAEYGLQSEVNLLGYVKLKTCFEKADIYLQPSTREGLCITAVEAMGAGLPVIGTTVGGMGDYGKHEQNMLHLKENNGKQLAAAIKRLIEDESLRKRIGEQGKLDMTKQFGETAVKAQLARVREALFATAGKHL